ncbi:tyrosine-type recombinase/integrase, partial [Acinetobacter baumannii]
SELYSFLVRDFNPYTGTLSIYDSKTDKPRHIILSHDATDFFLELTAGRDKSERMFLRKDGSPWCDDAQKAPMGRAVERGGIVPRITFHG